MKSMKESSSQGSDALDREVLRSFRVIFGSVRQHFRRVRRVSGVSGSQLWILHELLLADRIGVSDLANMLAIHQSTCSQLVEGLVRAGHVKKVRLTDDQRRVELTVTAKGRRALARAPGPAAGVLPGALGELSRADLRLLQRGLARVISVLDVKDAEDANRHMSEM